MVDTRKYPVRVLLIVLSTVVILLLMCLFVGEIWQYLFLEGKEKTEHDDLSHRIVLTASYNNSLNRK